jgi:hypothetical protein
MHPLFITNILVLLACIVISFKFWSYKKHIKKEIEKKDQQISEMLAQSEQMSFDLQSKKAELSDLKQNKGRSKFTDNILNKNKGGDIGDNLQPLLDEIEMLRKEKEEEMELRLEAEKQIELALQKTAEIQKRMEDWKTIQDASMKDSKTAIIDVGNELYKKLIKNHQAETDEEKDFIGSSIKNVSSYLEQIAKKIEFLEKNNIEFATEMRNVVENSRDVKPVSQKTPINVQNKSSDANNITLDETKELTKDLEKYFRKSNYVSKKDYFFDHDLNRSEESKLMFADCIFVKQNQLYIFDFKSQHYFENYKARSKNSDPQKLSSAIKEKLDKYISYLLNPKYKTSILALTSNYNLKFEKINVIAVVLSPKELQITEKLGYLKKFSDNNLKMLDIEKIGEIIL